MASETVDTLSLELQGNAANAKQSVNQLIDSLKNLKGSFEQAYGIVSKPLIVKTKIENTGDEAKNLQYSVQKAIDSVKPNTSKLAKQIANSFGVEGKKNIAVIKASLDSMVEGFAKSMGGVDTDFIEKSFEKMNDAITSSGKLSHNEIQAFSSLGGAINEADSDLARFYNDYKNVMFYISKQAQKDLGQVNFNESLLKNNLRNITADPTKGIDVNKTWGELTQNYPTLFSQETVNQADQIEQVFERLKQAREQIKPINIADLGVNDAKQAAEAIQQTFFDAMDNVSEQTREAFNKARTEASGSIQIDAIVDEKKIQNQIKQAIANASKMAYEPVKIKVNLDMTTLNDSLKSVDFSRFEALKSLNLGDTAVGIQNLAMAMSIFKQSTGLADFSRVANGLSKIEQINASGIIAASEAIRTFGRSMAEIQNLNVDSTNLLALATDISKFGSKTVTQAISNIPQISSVLSKLAKEMNTIGGITIDVSRFTELANAIARLGSKAAVSAPQSIRNISSALVDLMTQLSKAPQVSQNVTQLVMALSQFSGRAISIPSLSNGISRGFNLFGNAAKKATKHSFNLASAIGKVYATYWMLFRAMGLFKKAIDISSDLTEVQNVVDTVFGNSAKSMNEFAETSIHTVGMSELTAKQIGSKFQAMGAALGFPEDKMADMSLRLVKLTGDMSSFYNVAQSDVGKDLESIFTGMTRPLTLAA